MRLQQLIWLSAVLSLVDGESSRVLAGDLAPKREGPPRICPLPECGDCPPIEQLRAPGIGFALETGHGTAVVRRHDGTYHNVALIKGGDAYTALLRRLGTGPMDRTPDHFDTIWEKVQYAKARAQRRLNKLRGLPATADTAILAEMVAALRNATQTLLGTEIPVSTVAISSPDRVRLSEEENGDIFDYLGLHKLDDGRLYSVSAAYAGSGKGLCKNYLDEYKCESEDWNLPFERVLHIDFSEEALSASIKHFRAARYGGFVDVAFIDPELGYRHKPAQEDEDPAFWQAVAARVRELVQSMPHYVYMPHVSALLLTGTHVDNAAFQRAIKDALVDLVEQDALVTLGDAQNINTGRNDDTLTFLTARGAAEIAKRYLEGPDYCHQTDEYRRRREREHARKSSSAPMEQSVISNLDL